MVSFLSDLQEVHSDLMVAINTDKTAKMDKTVLGDAEVKNRYPQIGRDVPHVMGPAGYPVVKYETRVFQAGVAGLVRQTRCLSGCGKWLTYDMCNGCKALMRMTRQNDMNCKCFKDTLYIYGRCEDHKRYESFGA